MGFFIIKTRRGYMLNPKLGEFLKFLKFEYFVMVQLSWEKNGFVAKFVRIEHMR